MDNFSEITLLGPSDGPCGKLAVNVIPIDSCGRTPEAEDFEFIEDPDELLGKELRFRVSILNASNLPRRLANNVYVEFSLKYSGEIYT